MIDLKEIIHRINYFRTEKGISGPELSGRINKHERYISSLTSKQFNLPVPVLMNILEVLEISPVQFFAENYKTFNLDNHLFDLISKMPKDKKENLIKLIEN